MFQRTKVFGLFLACAIVPLIPGGAAASARIGLKGGLAIADVRGGFIENRTRLGAGAGFAARFDLGPSFALRPEALLVTKGTSLGESEETDQSGNVLGTFESIVAVDYLEIPVLLEATIPTGGRFRPILVTGPALGIELRERLVTTGSVNVSVDTGRFKSTDLGWALGAGVEMDLGRGSGSLEARYTAGLTNLAETGIDDDARNSAWMILAGYSIPIGR